MLLLNMLLTEWQLNRWLVWGTVQAVAPSTGVLFYSVGSGGDFDLSYAGKRPDRVDVAFTRQLATGTDTILYPFMSREGFDRVAMKGLGGPPESYFYDATLPNGTIHFYPAPDPTYQLFVKAKADLGQLAGIGSSLSAYPQQYIAAMLWNLAERMRPLYGMQPRADITQMAAQSLIAIGGSEAQMIQAQQPVPSNRAGVFSHVVAPQQGAGR